MKINKKVLIPVFATAMGLSVIGGISGAVAWYQYNTKVTASWMGVTTADGGVLQIYDESTSEWTRDGAFGDGTETLHPVTFSGMTATSALSSGPKKHPECGVADPTGWDDAVATDYVQFTVKIRARKLDNATKNWVTVGGDINLEEMVIRSVETTTDVSKAVRVHITDGTSNHLFSVDGGSIDTHGNLDLDDDGHDDVVGGYKAFSDYDGTTKIDYGLSGTQVSNSLSDKVGSKLFTIPAAETTLTITIWLEGWQKLNGSAIWDITKDAGANIQFGMKLSTPKDTFDMD